MGRLADEHLPEVVPHQPAPLPEVVPDSSPEAAAQQRFYMQAEKYPAHYDDAPKLPHEQPFQAGSISPAQNYQQPWTGGEYPVSAVSPNSSVPWQSFPPGGDGGDDQTYVGSEPPQPEKRICGIRKRLFIIIAVVVSVIVLAAAIGGGVGGAMASRRASSDEAQGAEDGTSSSSSLTSSTPTSTTATSSTRASTTSSAPSATFTFLNNQTNPDDFDTNFLFQGWSGKNYTGENTNIYRDEGFFDFNFTIRSYMFLLPKAKWCCATFCQNQTESAGFRCSTFRQPAASGDGFKRAYFWCGIDQNVHKEYTTRCAPVD